jgi:uncharacterized protein (DUF4213/DUF364 family)
MIIEQTYNILKYKYGDEFPKLTIKDVRIGFYLTAVRLSDNSIGTSATIPDNHLPCSKKNRDFGDFSPLKISGKKVSDILETGKESGLVQSLKTAVLNAMSSRFIVSGGYKIIDDCDPIQLIDPGSGKTITIVGAFQSYIRKISPTDNTLYVLEYNENALTEDQKKHYIPASGFKEVLAVSDIVIITGQTLVNNTIDGLLESVSGNAQVVVTGPSSNLVPDVLFENKVSIIGSSRITKPELLFDLVGEGGTGYHLYEYCARKICIVK